MDITFYVYGGAWDLLDVSPFCMKLEAFFRMAGVSYERKIGNPRKAPKGKLPYVSIDGAWMGDSHFIIHHLEHTLQINLDAFLSPEETAVSTAFRGMLEESYYFLLSYFRWAEPEGWKVYRHALSSVLRRTGAPGLMLPLTLPLLRRNVVKTLKQQGMGRHRVDELTEIGISQLDSLSTYLGNKSYFFGEQPCTIDATLFAMISSTLNAPIDSPLKQRLQALPNLCGYCENILQTYFS